MAIPFACPGCKTEYTVNDRAAGRTVECRVGGERVPVPSARLAKPAPAGPIPPRKQIDRLPPSPSTTGPGQRTQRSEPRVEHVRSPKKHDEDEHSPGSDDNPADDPSLERNARGHAYLPPIPKSRRWLIPAIGCAGAVGSLTVVATILILVFRGCDSKSLLSPFASEKDADLLAWAPPDSEAIFFMNTSDLMTVPEFRELASNKKPPKQKVALGLGEKERVVTAGRGKMGATDTVTIYQLANSYDPNPLIRAGHARQRQKDGRNYLEISAERLWLYQPSARVVITSENENLLYSAMAGKTDELRISQDLKRAYRDADGPVRGAAVGPQAQSSPVTAPLKLLVEKNPDPPPLCLAQCISTKLRSDRTEVLIVSTYSSSEKAKTAAGLMETGIKREMALAIARGDNNDQGLYLLRVIFDTFKAEASGDRVTISLQIPHRELKRLKFLVE